MIVDQTMNYAVADLGDGNFPAFVIADNKSSIASVFVITGIQVVEKCAQIFLEMILESMKFVGRFFTFFELEPASPNIF